MHEFDFSLAYVRDLKIGFHQSTGSLEIYIMISWKKEIVKHAL